MLQLSFWDAEPRLTSILAEQTASESCRERHSGSGLHTDSHTLYTHARFHRLVWVKNDLKIKPTVRDAAEEAHWM